MSLFGQQSKPSTSLFSTPANAPATSAQQPPSIQPSSLFGNLAGSQAQQQSQQQPSPFSALGEQAKTTAPPGAFGASLFPNLGNQSKPASSGLFGALAASQPQQTSASQSTGGLLAPQNSATSSQPFASSLFAPKQPQKESQQPNQTGQPQEQDGQQSVTGGKVPQPAYFNNLLEKSKRKANGGDMGSGFRDLPSLQLGLSEIAKRARDLGGMGSQMSGDTLIDGKA